MRRAGWWSEFGLGLATLAAGLAGCGGSNPTPPAANPAGTPVSANTPAANPGTAPGPEAPYVEPANDPARQPPAAAAEALRQFLLAMVGRDEAGLRRLTLNHPELPVLWQGERPPDDYLADAHKEIAGIAFYRVLPGDTVLDLEGKEMLVKEGDIKAGWTMLTFDENPIPFFLQEDQGQWKVHAAPIITTRKIAAAEAQMDALENEGQPSLEQPGVQPAEQLGSRPGDTVPPGGLR